MADSTQSSNHPMPQYPTTGLTTGVTSDPQRSVYAQRVMPAPQLVDVAKASIDGSTMLKQK